MTTNHTNRVLASRAPYGEEGVRFTVETTEQVRVRFGEGTQSAEAQFTMTRTEALCAAWYILKACGGAEAALAAVDAEVMAAMKPERS